MNGRRSKCRQACCRTPFGVCAKKGDCACHWSDRPEERLAAVREAAEKQAKMRQEDRRNGSH